MGIAKAAEGGRRRRNVKSREARVEVVYHATGVTMSFKAEEKAKAAYNKVSAALKEYQRYKNDHSETVEIETDEGLSTLRLERMDAVLFNPPEDLERVHRAALEHEKRVREIRAELGLPAKATD
jgi:hypothetical protein